MFLNTKKTSIYKHTNVFKYVFRNNYVQIQPNSDLDATHIREDRNNIQKSMYNPMNVSYKKWHTTYDREDFHTQTSCDNNRAL